MFVLKKSKISAAMRARKLPAFLLAALLLANCGCLKWNSTEPDEILFGRAVAAADQGKYTVARLTLQTLVNTYPDSDRVPEARQMIEDSYSKEDQSDPKPSECLRAESYPDTICFFPAAPQN